MTVVGIDVSKGKSMVTAMKPGGELVAAPYEVRHSDIELSRLALDVLCMERGYPRCNGSDRPVPRTGSSAASQRRNLCKHPEPTAY